MLRLTRNTVDEQGLGGTPKGLEGPFPSLRVLASLGRRHWVGEIEVGNFLELLLFVVLLGEGFELVHRRLFVSYKAYFTLIRELTIPFSVTILRGFSGSTTHWPST